MMRPIGDRVLVRRDATQELSPGGLYLAPGLREKPQRGVVVAVGEGRRVDSPVPVPMWLRTDDVVLFAKYAGAEVVIDDVEYVILREDDVLCVVSSDGA